MHLPLGHHQLRSLRVVVIYTERGRDWLYDPLATFRLETVLTCLLIRNYKLTTPCLSLASPVAPQTLPGVFPRPLPAAVAG